MAFDPSISVPFWNPPHLSNLRDSSINLQEVLVRLEQTTWETVTDGKEMYSEAKKMQLTSWEHNNWAMASIEGRKNFPAYYEPSFRERVHQVMLKLYHGMEQHALDKQQHRVSGFDQICDEIFYMPGLGQGYMAALANWTERRPPSGRLY